MIHATLHLVYLGVEDEDGEMMPMWNTELFIGDTHVMSNGGQMLEAVLAGVNEVLTDRVGPVEPHAGFPSDKGWVDGMEAMRELRKKAGVRDD